MSKQQKDYPIIEQISVPVLPTFAIAPMCSPTGVVLQTEVGPWASVGVLQAVCFIGGSVSESYTADAFLMAAQMLINSSDEVQETISDKPIYYTLQHLESGRRSTGSILLNGSELHVVPCPKTMVFHKETASAFLLVPNLGEAAKGKIQNLNQDACCGGLHARSSTGISWMKAKSSDNPGESFSLGESNTQAGSRALSKAIRGSIGKVIPP
ncbi:MAG: hypothetical protein JWQ71_3282 [Pedosphaera sp.]|nr:hypothetical protein [Pedosphaera sp.]